MNDLSTALTRMVPALERQIRPRLEGFVGSMVRSYLPQTWVFEAEGEAASLTVDREGNASVAAHALPAPDVTIQAKREILLAALTRGREASAHESDFHITTHTPKGRTAFSFLRQRFGI
ncbi:MAG: hypothetical protein ACREBT_04115 [Thermoplasmata archaeon]